VNEVLGGLDLILGGFCVECRRFLGVVLSLPRPTITQTADW
jgi:hypothetical protein